MICGRIPLIDFVANNNIIKSFKKTPYKNGESQIDKVVAVMPDGRVGSPCGACREYMMQLDKDSGEIEILLDLDNQKTVKLKDLIPDWWGTHKFTE